MSSSWVAGANKKKKEVARRGKYKKKLYTRCDHSLTEQL
jgi:hypothetical protein